MKEYLSWKWIKFDIHGWILVFKMNVLMYCSDKLMAQKDKKLLKTKFGAWFIELYGKNITALCRHMDYGESSGLQNISDKFWRTKNKT